MKSSGEPVIVEDIIRATLGRGLTMRDLEEMTLGMLIDFLTACSNKEINDGDTLYATAADYAAL